jgi:hypothetical protein
MAYYLGGDEDDKNKPTTPPSRPTRQDTADVVKSSEIARRFIENLKTNGKPAYVVDASKARRKSMPVGQLSEKQENARKALQEREQLGIKQLVINPKGQGMEELFPFSQYFKQVSPTRYEQREVENRVINPAIPPVLYDPRIAPDTVYQYKQVGGPDFVSIPGYSTRLIGKPTEIVQPVQRPPQRVPKKSYGPRVSFGTSNNRPTNQPGVGGQGGWWNRFK